MSMCLLRLLLSSSCRLGRTFWLQDLVCDEVLWVGLFPSVDDILRICQSINTGSTDHRVVSRGSVGHLHSTELQEGLAQSDPAEQHLPVAHVTGPVLVSRAASTSSNPIHVLITL